MGPIVAAVSKVINEVRPEWDFCWHLLLPQSLSRYFSRYDEASFSVWKDNSLMVHLVSKGGRFHE